MTFGNPKFIQKYEINKNCLIITFLDQSKVEMPFSLDSEKRILEQMLNEASTRNQSANLNVLENHRNLLADLDTFAILGMLYSLADKNVIFLLFCLCFSLPISIDEQKIMKQIEELEKYDIYSRIYEKLEKDIGMFLSVAEQKRKELNINTLDEFSLKEIHELESLLDSNFLPKKGLKKQILVKK